jgi:subtilisin family serine protease
VLVLPQPSVSASNEPAPFTEEIARTMVTSSPQTVGPENGALSWGLDRIDQRTAVSSPASYSFSSDGTGVKAYILDSGVSATHPDFGARVVDGWSYRASTTALLSYRNALSAYATDPRTGIQPCANNASYAVNPATFDNPNTTDVADKGKIDNDGHGTHVAGIIGGDTTGVAKGVTIVPVRSLDSCGNGTRTMILEALAWILNDHVAGQKAILNLSIGFDTQVTQSQLVAPRQPRHWEQFQLVRPRLQMVKALFRITVNVSTSFPQVSQLSRRIRFCLASQIHMRHNQALQCRHLLSQE